MSINADKISFYPLFVVLLLSVTACAGMEPLQTERVQPGMESAANESLQKLPPPNEKIVAAVYRFSDQTGQYKASDRVASWSTAVTQGATSILIKSMTNSGWFIPIERENLSNLLNERKIINSTRTQNKDKNSLPPLLFAGVLLEGGIVGYDTNIITQGAGIRYLGAGVSGQFRKDQVTIYLRAVSTQTGRILNTVHTTKSIISQQLDGGLFRYVDENQLLEAEAGYTFNEPPVMAVTEAIDEALKTLVVEGVDEGLWKPHNQKAFTDYKQQILKKDKLNKRTNIDYMGFNRNSNFRKGFNLSAGFIYGSHLGNYRNPVNMAGGSLQAEQFLSPSLSVVANGQRSKLSAADVFSEYYYGFDLKLRKYFTPQYALSPYIGIGAGGLMYEEDPKLMNKDEQFDKGIYTTANAQAGLDYRFSESVGFRIGFDYRYLIDDGLDGLKIGSIHDQQWNIITGLTISPKF